MSNDYKFCTEEEYLNQGRGCALNLKSDYANATNEKSLENIDPVETGHLEHRASMLNNCSVKARANGA